MGVDLNRLRHALGVAVTSLLVADLAAVGVVLAADRNGRNQRPSAQAAATSGRQLAMITTPDGRQLLADPSTSRGRQAIQQARDGGGSVSTIVVRDTDDGRPGVRPPFTIPAVDGVITIPKGGEVQHTIDSLLATLPGGGSTSTTTRGGGSTSSTAPTGPVTSLLDQTSSTLQDVVNTTPTTLPGLLGGTVSTVSSLLAPLVPTTTTPPLPSPTTTICVLVICQ